uniref:Galanin-like peptide n=1 Tax=Ursus americanus TaxID=9643 RepID=A0A452SVH4_URSAM
MAPSVRLALLLAILLSLAETSASVPVRQGRGGWTLNSVGYLLGPVPHLPQSANHGGKERTALEVLDLWKAIAALQEEPEGDLRQTRDCRSGQAQRGSPQGGRCPAVLDVSKPLLCLLLSPCLAPSAETEIMKLSPHISCRKFRVLGEFS